MAAFQDDTLEKLLDKVGKNVEEQMTDSHGSLVQGLLNSALEKDVSLNRCKNFHKLSVSPIYNTKFLQNYIEATENSVYSKHTRYYIPILAPMMRDQVFKPSLNLVTDWIKQNIFKISIKGLEKSVLPLSETLTGSSGVDWSSIIKELYHRFEVLHPQKWDGLIENDEIIVKVSEIATDLLYYTGLDSEIRKNLEYTKRQNGIEYAIEVTSRLENGGFFREIKSRGYFLDSELKTLKEIFPLIMCPTETCPQGFFSETLQSCNKKQRELIREMLMGLPPIQGKSIPENVITFESFLRYIISVTYLDTLIK